jgi:origin recognition complex subunit 1
MAAQSYSPENLLRKRRVPQGVSRDDSDDELGSEDLPWQWIYDSATTPAQQRDSSNDEPIGERKRRKVSTKKIVGARIGDFVCEIGDCVLLKAEGSGEAWVGMICEFVDDDDGEEEMSANFMWFSTEHEIRNKDKKRTDYLPVGSGGCCSPSTCGSRGLTSVERALHHALVGCESLGIHQWKSNGHVIGRI